MRTVDRIKILTLMLCVVLSGSWIQGPAFAAGPADLAQVGDQPAGSDMAAARLLSSDLDGVVVDLAAPEFQIVERTVEGTTCQAIEIALDDAASQGAAGWAATVEEGAPQVPVYAVLLGVPPAAALDLQVVDAKPELLDGYYDLCPVPTPVVDRGLPGAADQEAIPQPRLVGESLVKNDLVYATDAFYPADPVQLGDEAMIRQQRTVRLAMQPFQYDPVTGQLRVLRHMSVRVSFTYPQGVSPALSAAAEPESVERVLQQALLNYDTARNWRAMRTAGSELQSAWSDLIAQGDWFKISIQQTGLYSLSYTALAAAGVPVDSLDPHTFQLYNGGQELAIMVQTQNPDLFQPGDSILFYGVAINDKYTNVNVYWLTYGQNTGLRMAERDGSPQGSAPVPQSFASTGQAEQNVYYTSSFTGDDETERWIWNWIYASVPTSKNYTISLPNVASGTYTATLTANLYGLVEDPINPDHHVHLKVNNHQVADVWWDGIGWQQIVAGVMSSYLVSGNNTITVECPNDTGVGYDLVYADWFKLDYQRAYQAQSNQLAFGGDQAGSWAYHVAGFTASQIDTFDTTDPLAVVHIVSTAVDPVGGTYTLRFDDNRAAPADYLALTTTQRLVPVSIAHDTPSNWMNAANRANYIIITHADFGAAVQPLATFRQGQGYYVALVDVQDIYDEFNYGVLNPHTIEQFLQYAYDNWQDPAPASVLLVGDGNADYKDYRATGRKIYIPPRLADVDPFVGEVDADNRYVCVSGSDTMPDMSLGRLPAASVAEAQGMVAKILDYEQNPPTTPWNEHIIFAADNVPDSAGDFTYYSNDLIGNHLPAEYSYSTVYLNDYCGAPTDPPTACPSANAALVSAINAGALLVNYIGHGSVNLWSAENLWNLNGISALANSPMWPVMVAMTCDEGAFANPYSGLQSLGAMVVRSVGKGAVASWSPTGQAPVPPHHTLNTRFFDAVLKEGIHELGPATLAGKLALYQNGASPYLVDTFILFGDPALQVWALDADLTLAKTVEPVGQVTPGDVLTYTLTFANAGPVTIYDAVLTDILPAQLVNPIVVYTSPEVLGQVPGVTYAWNIADLAPAAVGTVVLRATVAPTSVGGVIDNQAELASGQWQATASASNDLYVPNADLSLAKTVEPAGQVDAGTALTYTLTFTNAGPDTAYSVVLTDLLPATLVTPTVLYVSPEVMGQQPGITYAWTITDLPPGSSGEIRLGVVVSPTLPPGSVVVNEASIAAETDDFVPANNTVSVTTGVRTPDLFVTKTGPQEVSQGQTITYTISWGNDGLLAASGVRLTDTLPLGVEYVADDSGLVPGYDPVSRRVVWQMPGDVPTGTQASFVLTGSVTLAPGLTSPLVNQVRIKSALSDANPLDNQATWPTTLLQPDLAVGLEGPGPLTVQTQITQAITYTNHGDALAYSVVLTEVLPAGLTYLSDDSGLTPATPSAGTYAWSLGDLAPGSSGSFVVTVAVGDYADVGTAVQASVLIAGAMPDRDEADNVDLWSADVLQPDLTVVKSGPEQAAPGSTITYTLTYANAGQGPAFGVTLSDLLPAGLTYLSDDSGLTPATPSAATYAWSLGDLAPGQEGTIHLAVQVGDLAATGPLVTNTLTVDADSPDALPGNNHSLWPVSIQGGSSFIHLYLPVVLRNVP